MREPIFEWDDAKSCENKKKHGVSFEDAKHAFFDAKMMLSDDVMHSQDERRLFCFGLDQRKRGVLTVRFTYRGGRIRIIGAGYWRKGRIRYEKKNSIQ